jgi:hypothetical protein
MDLEKIKEKNNKPCHDTRGGECGGVVSANAVGGWLRKTLRNSIGMERSVEI